MKNKKLLILNIILLTALAIITIKEDYHKRLIYKINSKLSSENKKFNSYWEYKHETELYKYYNKEGNIVMLGNSITYRANWNELLNRNDIINRGIGNDLTEGMVNRLESVINVNPKICFVMGGGNDINKGISPEIIASNINTIIKKLTENGIKPKIFSIIHVSETFPDFKNVNIEITQTNNLIRNLCSADSVSFIDLNLTLSKNNMLKEEYSFDGIHLSALGYNKWKEIITPIITHELSPQTD